MTLLDSRPQLRVPDDRREATRLQFYFFSARPHDLDFRQFLMEALLRKGHDVRHVRVAREMKVVGGNGRPIEFKGAAGFLALIRFLRADIEDPNDTVFLDSTGPYLPLRSLLLRAALGRGLWCYDIFDNLSYNYRGVLRVRARVAIPLLSRLSPVQLTLSGETLRLFPRAVHLDNAAHIGRVERGNWNQRDLVLLSSVDERLDIEFVRRVAASTPDTRLIVYGRAPSPQSLDALCRDRPNIVYRGEFRYGQIGAILAPFSVALAPYAINPLTEFINPDKYYYFLNSGMEVISTDIPQARRMRDRIHVARSPADVPAIVERLCRDPGARKNATGPVLGWDQRADEFLAIIARARVRRAQPDRTHG
jgi:hypothetical protein